MLLGGREKLSNDENVRRKDFLINNFTYVYSECVCYTPKGFYDMKFNQQ